MFKNLSSSSRKLQAQFDSLVFSRELVQDAESTFNVTPYPNSSLIGYDGEIACFNYDPVQSLLAVATKSGRITVYGDFSKLPRLSFSIKPVGPINHILLKSGSSCLLAIDAKNTLHVFDLADLDEGGEPKRRLSHSMRSQINCLESTPSLSHVFVGGQDGSVDTFDVERCVTSPYRIKNLWMEQDELLRRSGVPNAPSRKRISACSCVEVKSHPLDPNQLLVAYEGGVVLYDVTERSTIRTYEYIILPGAPGGHDDQTEGAFLERRPSCTCIAWRPDGKMFVAGYDDGSFAFWGLEDGDRPVMARTITKEDVNLATSSSLFGDDAQGPSVVSGSFREPIMKLAWSGFGGAQASKGTVLTVLGGLMPEDPKGLHCLNLPAFTAPSIIQGSDLKHIREAYKVSIRPNYTSVILCDTAPEDFLLLTQNPYFDRAYDAHSILVLLSPDEDLPQIAPHTRRGFTASTFPPSMLAEPLPMQLPIDLHLTGSQSSIWAEAVTLPSLTYKRLKDKSSKRQQLPLLGGEVNPFKKPPANSRVHDSHHAVLTVSQDMTVRIWDYSKALPSLLDTFSARDGLDDDQLMQYLDGQMQIEHVSAAWDNTEMVFGLSTGDVLFFKFEYARPSAVLQKEELDDMEHYRASPAFSSASPPSGGAHHDNTLANTVSRMRLSSPDPGRSAHIEPAEKKPSRLFGRRKEHQHSKTASTEAARVYAPDLFLQDTTHLADHSQDGYKSHFSLASTSTSPGSRPPKISALKLSDAGFLAIAWGCQIAVIDLRGREVLYNELVSSQGQGGNVVMLDWTACAEGEDSDRHPRLLATMQSGTTYIHTLSYTLDTWIVNTQVQTLQQDPSEATLSKITMDPHGSVLQLNSSTLDQCLRAAEMGETHVHTHSSERSNLNTLLISIGPSAMAVHANLTGDRLFKRDFGNARAIAARIVQKYSMPVLTVLFHDGQCVIFSLPQCEPVRTMQLPFERAWPSISPDGRILQMLSPSFYNLMSILRDSVPPTFHGKYYQGDRVVPPAPGLSVISSASTAAASYISSWFSNETAKKWEPVNLDDILGGPNRPPPRVKVQPVREAETLPPQAASTSGRPSRLQASASSSAPRDRVKEVEVEYNRFGIPKKRHELTDKLEERGERLNMLDEHLENASKASQDFLSQARKTAMLQTAKGAATGVGKGAMYSFGKLIG